MVANSPLSSLKFSHPSRPSFVMGILLSKVSLSKKSFQPIFKALQSVLRSFRRISNMLSTTLILRTSIALLSAASLEISFAIPPLNGQAATGDFFRVARRYCVEPQIMHTLEPKYTHIFQLDYYNWHTNKTFEAHINCDSDEAILINQGTVHRD